MSFTNKYKYTTILLLGPWAPFTGEALSHQNSHGSFSVLLTLTLSFLSCKGLSMSSKVHIRFTSVLRTYLLYSQSSSGQDVLWGPFPFLLLSLLLILPVSFFSSVVFLLWQPAPCLSSSVTWCSPSPSQAPCIQVGMLCGWWVPLGPPPDCSLRPLLFLWITTSLFSRFPPQLPSPPLICFG